MNSGLFTLYLAVIIQRLVELQWARKNSRWMRRQGGIEIGDKHYPWLVGLHTLFFVSILFESFYFHTTLPMGWPLFLGMFIVTQFLRYWCIRSLGRFWNTRIWVLPNHSVRLRGPYRYLRHPNYLVVIAEFIIYPCLFGAYWTALLFSLLNGLFLSLVRIPQEEQAIKHWMVEWPTTEK